MKRYLFVMLLIGCAGAPEADGKDEAKPAKGNPVVEMKTSMGTVKIELFADKAPTTVKNFLQYAADKHYDGTVFHRVIKGFMIQGGGFDKGLSAVSDIEGFQKKQRKTRAAIKNEAGNKLSNERGTIAMARTGDPNSATSQFFINVENNSRTLDRTSDTEPDEAGYCVFGKVIAGMDVVDKIRAVKTKVLVKDEFGRAIIKDVPVDEVVIESVKKVE